MTNSKVPISDASPAEDAGASQRKSDEEQAAFENATIRRIDICVLPLLGLLYAIAVVDRTNLSVARVVGMERDLDLAVGSRYSIVSCLYFVPYILLQLPSNIFLRYFGARHWLSFNVIAWGAVQIAMAFVPNWGLLAFCRAMLGAFEAASFPCVVFIVTTWYKRHEVQTRLAGFYIVSILIGAFSSIFGYLISLLDGKVGIAGWSWIFIIEGAMTALLGVVIYFFVSDFPHKSSFLTREQSEFALRRVEEDRGDSVPDKISYDKVLQHLSDWTIWAYALMFFCATVPAYAIGFFIVIILNGMGWSVTQSLLLTTPPYVFAAIFTLFFAWLSDKLQKRALFIAIQAVLTSFSLVLTAYATVDGWRYVGISLAAAGSAACVPGILAYSANNIISHSKRAVSISLIIAFGGLGGIFATTVFRQQDFPKYIPGLWASVGSQILMLVLLAIMTTHYTRKNRLAGSGSLVLENLPGFLYTI